jgi:hypothetical protein
MLFKATGDLKYRDEALFYAMALDVKVRVRTVQILLDKGFLGQRVV